MRSIKLAFLLLLAARACDGASSATPRDARSAALGGISVVGETASPQKAAVLPSRGLHVEASWANPYGIEGLYVASLSLRRHWSGTSAAVSMRSLNTPTSYGEVHLLAALSLAATEHVSIGAGAGLGWLSDSEGAFAREADFSLGLALGRPGKWELGCAAMTPISAGLTGDENGGVFRWGFGLPLADRLTVALEEERRSHWSVRRFGGEMDLTGGVTVRAGFSNPPLTVSLGVGLTARDTSLSLAVVQHEVLGATPYVTIAYGGPNVAAGESN